MPRCLAKNVCKVHTRGDCTDECRLRRRCGNSVKCGVAYCGRHLQNANTNTMDDYSSHSMDNCCPICFEDILPNKDRISLKCNHKTQIKHVFHKTCLTGWLEQDKSSCPTCRSNINPTIITRLDPDRQKRAFHKAMSDLDFHVPGVARFLIPRHYGQTDEDILMSLIAAALHQINDV